MTVSSFDKMIEEHGVRFLREKHRDEIERAIRNAQRTAWDKWFRKEWYKAGARSGKRGMGARITYEDGKSGSGVKRAGLRRGLGGGCNEATGAAERRRARQLWW